MQERKDRLKQAGLKGQTEAAERMGVSRHTVHRWVNGDDSQECLISLKGNGTFALARVPISWALEQGIWSEEQGVAVIAFGKVAVSEKSD